jgi:26S proteasome regulatory subunit N5
MLFQIFDTSTTKADSAQMQAALESCVIFLLLSKHDNHQSDMLHRLKLLKELERAPLCSSALNLFTTPEIIPLPFEGQQAMEAHASIRKGGAEHFEYFIKTLNKRVIEHNLRTVAGYYRRIRSARLGEMLGLEADQLESHLSELASDGDIHVKIDRPAGIVSFEKPRAPEAVLSDWASDMGKLLSVMESTCHLINRENMVHSRA